MISDELFAAARERMRERHADEYEDLFTGRSEEMPRDQAARHANEIAELIADRGRLDVQQWRAMYPESVLQQAGPRRETEQAQTVTLTLTRQEFFALMLEREIARAENGPNVPHVEAGLNAQFRAAEARILAEAPRAAVDVRLAQQPLRDRAPENFDQAAHTARFTEYLKNLGPDSDEEQQKLTPQIRI